MKNGKEIQHRRISVALGVPQAPEDTASSIAQYRARLSLAQLPEDQIERLVKTAFPDPNQSTEPSLTTTQPAQMLFSNAASRIVHAARSTGFNPDMYIEGAVAAAVAAGKNKVTMNGIPGRELKSLQAKLRGY